MTRPDQPDEKKNPAQQRGEEHGQIKRSQQTDRNMADVDTARGSERETRGASGPRS